jgi:hypothetical protein
MSNSLKDKQNQTGAVLIISLLLLLVASIVTVSSMRGSGMQERMVANQNQQSIALMSAETGASEFWRWISDSLVDWDNTSWRNSWQDEPSLPSTSTGTPIVGGAGYYWIDPSTDITWLSDRAILSVNGAAISDSGDLLSQTRIQIELLRPTPGGVNPAFMAGMLAGGNINIQGNASFTGSAHANGNFNVTGGNSSLNDRSGVDESGDPITMQSTVSAQANASMSGASAGAVISDAPAMTIPSASDYIAANKDNAGVINSCTIPSGDLGGATYYCDGSASTSGSFSNVTILATGDITHNGSSQLGLNNSLTVQIIAAGNITVNGSNDTYGVFWTDGNVTQRGSSILGGSIVAGGNITRNGVFNYQQYDDFGDLTMPTGPGTGLSIARWFELR